MEKPRPATLLALQSSCLVSFYDPKIGVHNDAKQLPYCTYKQDRVLGDHSQLGSEVLQTDGADIHAVDEDGAAGWLHQAEQGHS